MQLFTENTITVIQPVATHPTVRNFSPLVRLGAIVFCSDMAGTFLVAAMMVEGGIISGEQLSSVVDISAPILDHGAWTTLVRGMAAGFLVASIAWILPNARGGEFWIVVLITYLIALGDFSHVVAGSTEAWLLRLVGRTTLWGAVGGFILPALGGNIIGGTGLFAVLAHGQVREENAADPSSPPR